MTFFVEIVCLLMFLFSHIVHVLCKTVKLLFYMSLTNDNVASALVRVSSL